MPTLSWLHFTDFHQGMQAQSHLWPGIREIFIEDIKRLHDLCGPWDMVLFTGDLTQGGKAEEFARLDEMLGSLWEVFRALGSTPVLLPVPGNHDLEWPHRLRPEALVLKQWDSNPEVQNDLFEAETSKFRNLLEEVFSNYQDWVARTELPKPAKFEMGLLPGDFSATVEKEGFELGIVGLNSAFLQLGSGDYRGRLAVDVRQFHGACGGDGPAWVRKHECAVLLTHHPPEWLSPAARQHVKTEIHTPGRFVAHLFGHMHEGALTSIAIGGAPARRELQGSSLFGLKEYGPRQERRQHGYSAGTISRSEDGTAKLRLWPRVAVRHSAGDWYLRPDVDRFKLEDDQGTKPDSVIMTRKRGAGPGSSRTKQPSRGEQKTPKVSEHELSPSTGTETTDGISTLIWGVVALGVVVCVFVALAVNGETGSEQTSAVDKSITSTMRAGEEDKDSSPPMTRGETSRDTHLTEATPTTLGETGDQGTDIIDQSSENLPECDFQQFTPEKIVENGEGMCVRGDAKKCRFTKDQEVSPMDFDLPGYPAVPQVFEDTLAHTILSVTVRRDCRGKITLETISDQTATVILAVKDRRGRELKKKQFNVQTPVKNRVMPNTTSESFKFAEGTNELLISSTAMPPLYAVQLARPENTEIKHIPKNSKWSTDGKVDKFQCSGTKLDTGERTGTVEQLYDRADEVGGNCIIYNTQDKNYGIYRGRRISGCGGCTAGLTYARDRIPVPD